MPDKIAPPGPRAFSTCKAAIPKLRPRIQLWAGPPRGGINSLAGFIKWARPTKPYLQPTPGVSPQGEAEREYNRQTPFPMTRSLFGTDGIRGTANTEPMTPETALKVAMAVGEVFHNGSHKHLVVIGKDTRLSGYMLEPALTAGFVTMGMDVVLVGPLPTPAIAMLTRSLRADIGVILSASHNSFADNGIKLFGPDGYKLSDEIEARIERIIETGPAAPRRAGRPRPRQAA